MSQIVDFNAGGGGGGEDKTVITINVGDPATEVSDNSLVLLSAGAAGPSGPITINLPAASEIKKGIILKKMSNYVILTTINPATGDSIEFAGMNEPLVSITPESYQAFVSAGSILSITGISATQSVIENVFNPVETLIFNAANIGTNPVSPPLTYFNDIPRISYRQVSPAPVGIPTVDLNTNKLIAKPVGSYGVWLEYLSFNKPPVNLEMSKYVVDRVQSDNGGNLQGRSVLIVGVAYKPNVTDVRETAAELVIKHLRDRGAVVSWHDEVVGSWNGESSAPLSGADIAVVITKHDVVTERDILASAPYVFDTTGKVVGAKGL
jgi:UDP-N-acetyl-D-glucosamine dehydrogenase